MIRWVIWGLVLAVNSGSGTLASRARNTPSYGYHGGAALLSHGSFFVGQVIGIDLIVEIIQTRSASLAVTGFLVYALTSTVGSLTAQWIAIRFFEKGHRRVGAYEDNSR